MSGSPAAWAAPRSLEQLDAEINETRKRGDYLGAARLIEEAYDRNPHPYYLYALGEMLFLAGDCQGATEAFDRYLATEPSKKDAGDVRARKDACSEPEPGPVPEPTSTPEPEPPPPKPAPPPRLAQDGLLWGLTAAGTVVSLAGGGLLVATRVAADETNRVTTESAWDRRVARTRTLANAGTAMLSIGGALLIGAAIRAITYRRRSRARG